MQGTELNILTYHSISSGPGPVCLSIETFRAQMAILEECGFHTVALSSLVQWLHGEEPIPPRSVVLTFDDGFVDFAEIAYPELSSRGWSATVFLPTAKVGGTADWERQIPAKRLLSWTQVEELSGRGIDFGAHGVHHLDLTLLSPEVARAEIVHSKQIVAEHTERPVSSFAAPYGRLNRGVGIEIRKHFPLAVGTTLAPATNRCDPWDLPRIEMWYFRDSTRWRTYLQGGARGYFHLRQTMRRAREVLTRAGSLSQWVAMS